MKKLFLGLACCSLLSCVLAQDVKPVFNKSWSFDGKKNNLHIKGKPTIDKRPRTDERGAPVVTPDTSYWIVFNDYLLRQDAEGKFKTMHALADTNMNHGIYSKRFLINNKPFTGTLVGVLSPHKEIIFEIAFRDGMWASPLVLESNKKERFSYIIKPVPEPIEIPTEEPTENREVPIEEPIRVYKPVIYLYPAATQNVRVALDYNGTLTHTYPKYPAQGWNVEARPDGELRDLATGKTYYELFWEGESHYKYDVSTGFVVKGEETADFLDNALAQLGLNRREANEFITFWLPQLERNPYNLLHFATTEYTTQAKLNVSPHPDTEIRFILVYSPLSQPINIKPQTLNAPPRKGFTLVEWGGQMQPLPTP